MKNFYLNSIKSKKRRNKEAYEKVSNQVFGSVLSWVKLCEQENDKLIEVMCLLSEQITINKSPYDIKKLTHAIQHSRSGIGFCAMTPYQCSFCGKEEVWGSTATPNICSSCAEEMATNIIARNFDITKEGKNESKANMKHKRKDIKIEG